MKYLLFLVALFSVTILTSRSEEKATNDSQSMEKTEHLLKAILSYSSSGQIEVLYSAVFLQMIGHSLIDNKKTFDYEVLAKEGQMKLKLTELSPKGSKVSEVSHYLTPTSYYRIESDGFAIMTSDIRGADESNMNDFYGPFAVFSFLVDLVADYGLRPVTASALNNSAAWSTLLDPTKTQIKSGGRDKFLLSAQRAQGRWEVVFSKQSNGFLMPQEIKFYERKNRKEFMSRHLIVEDLNLDSTGLFLPKRFAIECYAISPTTQTNVLMATLSYNVDKTVVGPDIDDLEFKFDPSTVRRIWDADHKKFVNVPN